MAVNLSRKLSWTFLKIFLIYFSCAFCVQVSSHGKEEGEEEEKEEEEEMFQWRPQTAVVRLRRRSDKFELLCCVAPATT